MTIVKIISEWKRVKKPQDAKESWSYPKPGMKRVMAIVQTPEGQKTRHIDIPKN